MTTLIRSPHADDRLRERTESTRLEVHRLVVEALRQRAWNEFWEYDPREQRGICRNLLVQVAGSFWVLVRQATDGTYIAVSVLTQKQYENNVALLWHRDAEAARLAMLRRKDPKPLTHNPFKKLKVST